MNCSKPRNSTMCRRTCWMRLSSPSSSVTLPWPSTRETGSITMRRRPCGSAAVSSGRGVSVIADQALVQRGLSPGDEVLQQLPEGIGRRRAAGQRVFDALHLVDGVLLVEDRKEFGVVGHGSV